MNRLLTIIFCLNSLLFNAQINNKKQKTELIIIGTTHFPTKQINKDTIYSILESLKPDIILMESDMTNFNSDFTFKNTYDENEWNAIVKYRTHLVSPWNLVIYVCSALEEWIRDIQMQRRLKLEPNLRAKWAEKISARLES